MLSLGTPPLRLGLPSIRFLQLVIFDYRIREQIAAKTVKPFLKIGTFAVEIYLHVFANPNALHFRHAKVSHRIAHRIALRIEHCFLGFDDHIEPHLDTLMRICSATSVSGTFTI